ncbi:MAG: glutamate synthase subunit beta [Actinobacteria bacterium]|nr:glutamate synthase subunit beta [Actinomycetota bacterium]MBW3646946.1 glutamate synthase subunit beta [Actinomycetota bacterium]
MGDPTGFLRHERALPTRRPVDVRIRDWKEVYEDFPAQALHDQAGRCMDCGIPFCHNGCPLGNLIPEWNDLTFRDDWEEAIERLHATNNFPEFTGRLCPAPCETACVLGINDKPVTIKQVEVEIIDRAFAEGWVTPQPPRELTGRKVAVIGSGPAGLAAAQQLTRAGHDVTVFERADRIGGLLRYGIPEFKMEKRVLDRRLEQLRAEGTSFRTGVDVGVDVPVAQLRADYDALLLTGGSTVGRDLPVEGRDLDGIHLAMTYLEPSNRVQEGDLQASPISAEGKDVVILGGGDTGADCLGTAIRQGARSITQLEIMPRPPEERPDSTPWPTWPLIYRTSSAHEEGGERMFSVNTQRFVGADGRLSGLELVDVELVDGRFTPVDGTARVLPAQLVLLAMGFTGPLRTGLLEQLGVELDGRGNVARGADWATSVPGVFVAGDMGRGQSLIVWAIAEGRSAAAAVDRSLCGETLLPAPITPTSR